MKSLLLLFILSVGFLSSCKTAKNKKQRVKIERSLNGNWELNYISSEEDLFSFEELYPEERPSLHFNLKAATFSGNTSCNGLSGELKIEANKIAFKQPIAMTEMHCEGAGEEKFLDMLEKVDTYSISEDNVLALMSGDVAILRFVRK